MGNGFHCSMVNCDFNFVVDQNFGAFVEKMRVEEILGKIYHLKQLKSVEIAVRLNADAVGDRLAFVQIGELQL